MTAIENYAEQIIDILFAAHTQESDDAAKPLAAMLLEHAPVIASKGTFGLDLTALVEWGGCEWAVYANNGWTAVKDVNGGDVEDSFRSDLGLPSNA